jgi:hypothetical protein
LSKESRRRQRQAGRMPAGGPTAARPEGGSPAGPTTRSTGPRGTERAGRRERTRPYDRPSTFQRYRTIILGAAIVAVVAVIGAGVFASASAKAYACSHIWEPSPTPSPREGASPQPGYVQPDMGRSHVTVGTTVTYTYCPPASGNHYSQPTAPITSRVYGPGDAIVPEHWIHNLEHGGLVILYKGEADQVALKALFDAIPPSPICGFEPGGQSPGPVIARFDDMATPFAVLVWGRVLPLQTLDTQAILDFYAAWGEKTNPEQQCAAPSASPASSETPSASAATSAEPSTGAGSSAAPSTPPASGGAVAPSAPASASPS